MIRIKTEKEYKVVMKSIEGLLETATKKGGFQKLTKEESGMLERLSMLAEEFEDNVRGLCREH